MTDEELAEIEKRWSAVTKGDWYCDCQPSGPCAAKCYRETVEVYNGTERVIIAQRPTYDCGNKKQTFADMLAIAKAPLDVRRLIAEVRRLRAEAETIEVLREWLKDDTSLEHERAIIKMFEDDDWQAPLMGEARHQLAKRRIAALEGK